jgi:hypothetical protein
MKPTPVAAGFGGHSTSVASHRLTDAVVVSLAFSIGLAIVLTVLTIKSGLI